MAKASKKSVKAAKVSKATSKSNAAKAEAKAEKVTLDNCYRNGGGYWSVIQALRSLGIGKRHSFEKILPAIKKAMGANWKAFAAKKGKLSADERAMVNLMVTSREDYGAPVRASGYVVEYDGRAKEAALMKIK